MYYKMYTPSFYAHVTSALLMLIAVIILYTNYSEIFRASPDKLICITLLFSISMGIHSLTHLGLEKGYGYNPLLISKHSKKYI